MKFSESITVKRRMTKLLNHTNHITISHGLLERQPYNFIDMFLTEQKFFSNLIC